MRLFLPGFNIKVTKRFVRVYRINFYIFLIFVHKLVQFYYCNELHFAFQFVRCTLSVHYSKVQCSSTYALTRFRCNQCHRRDKWAIVSPSSVQYRPLSSVSLNIVSSEICTYSYSNLRFPDFSLHQRQCCCCKR